MIQNENKMKLKLTKKSLIGNSMLIMISMVSVSATHQFGNDAKPSLTDSTTTTTRLSFDTLLFRLNGATGVHVLNAPAVRMNKQAALYVDKYIIKNIEDLERIKQRSKYFFQVTDAVFARFNLPQELKYLAVIESELNTRALSHVGARGAWQLMPETARILSLKVTSKYDERTHFYKSTVAAAKYLRDLHAMFGDWLLVLASYNGGPGRVLDAIKKSGSRNFWKLQNFLPAETRGHVKRFIATHYYFEGKGSITTLTKKEADMYKKEMLAYVETENLKKCQEELQLQIVNDSKTPANLVVKADKVAAISQE
jgi:membrane-bound lytic murein transglycosylase D